MMQTRILIVDDEPRTRDLLARLLREPGYDVRTAGSAAEALASAKAEPPDLVLADVHMPGGSGLDLARRLPEACGLRVPVLLLSGLGEEADILAGYDAGACDYLCKPWRNEELLAKVRLHTRERAPVALPPTRQPVRTIGGGRVRLGRQIGVGGMGSVFRGEDARLGRAVAVKILRPDLANDPSYVVRFLQEARVLSHLDQPGIPRVHDVGKEEGFYYYVMDLLRGESLRDRVRRAGALGPRAMIELALGVARILESLEREGVVHRDIKPDNLLLQDDGAVGLVDFGLARGLHDARLTDPSQVVGTAGYLAPEQLAGDDPPDVRGDLYALGMTLTFAATGRDPGAGDTSASLVAALSARAVRLDRLMPGAPAPLVAAVRALTEPEPKRRPQTAHAARLMLEQAAEAMRAAPLDTLAMVG